MHLVVQEKRARLLATTTDHGVEERTEASLSVDLLSQVILTPPPAFSEAPCYTMGRLVIAHHKSYHPYRRDNIEKVRRDEEEAQRAEEAADGRTMLAVRLLSTLLTTALAYDRWNEKDSEARIEHLREKAGIEAKKEAKRAARDDMKRLERAPGTFETQALLPTRGGHINLFEDLENVRSSVYSLVVLC